MDIIDKVSIGLLILLIIIINFDMYLTLNKSTLIELDPMEWECYDLDDHDSIEDCGIWIKSGGVWQ